MSRTIACGRRRLVRLVAMVLITLNGRRVNALRSEEEEVIPLRRYRERGCESAQTGRLGGADGGGGVRAGRSRYGDGGAAQA